MSVCSLLYGYYEQLVDRESAYEILKARAATSPEQAPVEADRGFNWSELLGGGAEPDESVMLDFWWECFYHCWKLRIFCS